MGTRYSSTIRLRLVTLCIIPTYSITYTYVRRGIVQCTVCSTVRGTLVQYVRYYMRIYVCAPFFKCTMLVLTCVCTYVPLRILFFDRTDGVLRLHTGTVPNWRKLPREILLGENIFCSQPQRKICWLCRGRQSGYPFRRPKLQRCSEIRRVWYNYPLPVPSTRTIKHTLKKCLY